MTRERSRATQHTAQHSTAHHPYWRYTHMTTTIIEYHEDVDRTTRELYTPIIRRIREDANKVQPELASCPIIVAVHPHDLKTGNTVSALGRCYWNDLPPAYATREGAPMHYCIHINSTFLSSPLLHVCDTIAHEFAHACIHIVTPAIAQYRPHGAEWVDCMKSLGVQEPRASAPVMIRLTEEDAIVAGYRWACIHEGECFGLWHRKPKYGTYVYRHAVDGVNTSLKLKVVPLGKFTVDELDDDDDPFCF